MFVYGLKVKISIPYSHSLKEKRMVIRSVIDRLKKRMDVTAVEVENRDMWQLSTIGISWISLSISGGKNKLSSILNFIEEDGRTIILDYDCEKIKVGSEL